MGMSTHVDGFKAPDDTFQRMKAVWDACTAADVEIPDEVAVYFEGEQPDPAGVVVPEESLRDDGAVRPWEDTAASGFEVVVAAIPKDVTTIRFYNAW